MKITGAFSLALLWILPKVAFCEESPESPSYYFNRVSFFPVCRQLHPTCNTDNVTVSEIVTVSEDGMTLFYTDSEMGVLGFVDITDPYKPTPLGFVEVGGEPTSVTEVKGYAVVVVNTSPDFVNTSGILHVISIDSMEVLRTMDLGGQPDSVDTSPDERFVAIAIENERNEDFNDGALPQMPPGFMQILKTESDDVMEWELTKIDLVGLDGLIEPSDPEPEYVAINEDNVLVVTLQENNAIVLIDLESSQIITSFSAGFVNLSNVDVVEDQVIFQNASATLKQLPREPDGVTWLDTELFATADEGDWNGGTRGFTVFDTSGNIVYTSGDRIESMATMVGHYPEARAEGKGNEPENVDFGMFGDTPYLFVNSERSSLVLVFDISDPADPIFKQLLPAGFRPEGIKAIPNRDLLVAASEVDDRGAKVRSGITIYALQEAFFSMYPTLISAIDDATGNPIPFGALSGLAAAEPYGTGRRKLSQIKRRWGAARQLEGEVPQLDPEDHSDVASSKTIFYSAEDGFYKKNRIFVIDASTYPAAITDAMHIMDSDGVFADALGETSMAAALINADNTVNIDPEGISVSQKGGFWLVHEGSGSVGDTERPVTSPNVLFKLSNKAVIEKVVLLPADVNELQVRFGFEGVAEDGNHVVVTIQRPWGNETYPRIGIYNTETEEWKFVYYPLDKPESQNGGFVGLSDIAPLREGKFMVIERDDQSGDDAAIKRLFVIDLGDFSMDEGTTISKELFMDLMPAMADQRGAQIEKIEGVAVTSDGLIFINTDNDGLDDNSGEQLFLNVGTF